MTIELTAGQTQGLQLALRLAELGRNGRCSVGTVAGYAGTGKTTLLKFILSELEGQGGAVLLSPTGKAAARITEVTGYQASTIHRWIYKANQDTNTGAMTFTRKELDKIERPDSGLIVVDEASMMGPDVWDDLLSTAQALRCSVVLIGDGYQLPPVLPKGETFSVMGKTFVPAGNWVQLTEILRQAENNPIIRVSMGIREGDIFEALSDLDVVAADEIDGALLAADMRICRSNKVRHALNRKCRSLLGYTGPIMVGEPLLVLQNNYSAEVYNGETHAYQECLEGLGKRAVYDNWTKEELEVSFEIALVAGKQVILAQEALDGGLDGKLGAFALQKACGYWQREKRGVFLNANYGYVLTAHKSQGSEADKVVICMESSMNFTREEDRRWFYTAITRAREQVSVFQGDSVRFD